MKFPEKYRKAGLNKQNGTFEIPFEGRMLTVIGAEGMGWEHVSVSLLTRNPNWREMSFIKSLFWEDIDCVMQLHPSKEKHINFHPYCLHLWRPQELQIPMPPIYMV